MKIEEIIKEVKDILSEKRFYHSECVMKRAEELAEIYGADIEKAKICGILHDLAKEMKKTDLLEYALKNNIEVNEVEEKSPGLLHGKVAGHIAKNKYGIDDEMVEAISYHTTGKENMKLLTEDKPSREYLYLLMTDKQIVNGKNYRREISRLSKAKFLLFKNINSVAE